MDRVGSASIATAGLGADSARAAGSGPDGPFIIYAWADVATQQDTLVIGEDDPTGGVTQIWLGYPSQLWIPNR